MEHVIIAIISLLFGYGLKSLVDVIKTKNSPTGTGIISPEKKDNGNDHLEEKSN